MSALSLAAAAASLQGRENNRSRREMKSDQKLIEQTDWPAGKQDDHERLADKNKSKTIKRERRNCPLIESTTSKPLEGKQQRRQIADSGRSVGRRKMNDADDSKATRRRRQLERLKQLEGKLMIPPRCLFIALLCLSLLAWPTNQINLPSRSLVVVDHQLIQVPTTRQQQLRSISSPATTTNHQQQQQTSNRLAQFAASSLQFSAQHPDAPKLIPLSALDQYQEGADLRLFCSASAPQTGGRLHFEWRKNQAELLAPISNFEHHQHHQAPPPPLDQLSPINSIGQQQLAGRQRLQISLMDESASVLRIGKLEADDAGNYTCLVRNQHGFDSSTVRVSVNVKLKWTREPPAEVKLRAGKSLHLECDATGQPEPLISWTNLKDQRTISSKILRIERVSVNDSALYECRAISLSNNANEMQQSGDKLRKLVRVTVNGK